MQEDSAATAAPNRPSPLPWAVGGLVLLAVLVFLPHALDQFRLPKRLVLAAGVPALGAVFLSRRWRGAADRTLLVLGVAFLLWNLLAPVSAAANPTLHALGGLRLLLPWTLLPLTAAAASAGGAAGRRLAALAGAAGTAVGALALLQWSGADPIARLFHAASPGAGRWRILTTVGNPGWTAETVAAALPLALAGLGPGRGRRALRAGLVLAAAAAVAVTGSRTGAVALAAGAGAWLAARRGGRRGRALLAGLATASAAGAVVLVLATTAGTARLGDLAPLTGRLALWDAGARLTARHPLTGNGLGHTAILLPEGLREVVAAAPARWRPWLPTSLVDRLDDDWLQTALEAGLPAVLLLLAIWGRAAALAWRHAPENGAAGAVGALAALGTGTLFSAPLHTPATAVLFWTAAGIAGAGRPKPVPAGARRRRLAAAAALAAVAAGAAGAGAALVRLDLAAGRGRTLLRRGHAAAAVPPLDRAFRRAPWLVPAGVELADALERTGRHAEALAVTIEAGRWTASERLWAIRARALAASGHPGAARTVLDRGLAVLPRSRILLAERTRLAATDSPNLSGSD